MLENCQRLQYPKMDEDIFKSMMLLGKAKIHAICLKQSIADLFELTMQFYRDFVAKVLNGTDFLAKIQKT